MITICKYRDELIKLRRSLLNETIGLVPTMGNLHEGHLSLIKKSMDDNPITVISIFINPIQFAPHEDKEKYPRTIERDISLIASIIGTHKKHIIIFIPCDEREIYPRYFSTQIKVIYKKSILCDRIRKGHFDGVTTIIYILLSLVQPHKIYLGQKDYQQYFFLKKMIQDLMIPVEIILRPTVRDSQGLALSSRNQYLKDSKEKLEAIEIIDTLRKLKLIIHERTLCKKLIEETLQIPGWEYLTILDPMDLSQENKNSSYAIILAARKVGEARLIDNLIVDHR